MLTPSMSTPCKGCPDRAVGCHAKCGLYAQFVAENEQAKRKRRLDNICPGGAKMMKEQSLRKKMKRR